MLVLSSIFLVTLKTLKRFLKYLINFTSNYSYMKLYFSFTQFSLKFYTRRFPKPF